MARATRVKSRAAERTEIAAVQILGDRHGVLALAAEDGASVALVLAPNQRLMARQFIVAIYTCIKYVTALESYSHDIAFRVVVRTLSLLSNTGATHNHLDPKSATTLGGAHGSMPNILAKISVRMQRHRVVGFRIMAGKQIALYCVFDDKTLWPISIQAEEWSARRPAGPWLQPCATASNSDWLSIAERHNNWRLKGASKKIHEHYLYFSTAVCALARRGGGGGGGPAGAFSRGDASHFTSHAAGGGGIDRAVELE